MGFDIRDVGYFLRAAQVGHVGRAAASLGITQPALTKAIARLERELGLRLFERTPQGIVPTAAGDAFRERAGRIQAEYEDTMRLAGDLRAGSAGLLRVGASFVASDVLITPALAGLLRRRPSLRISLTVRPSAEVLDGLRAGQLDVCVVSQVPSADPVLEAMPLGADALVVVAAQRHPVFRRATPALAELARYGWILPRGPGVPRQWIDGVFARAGLAPPAPTVEADYGSPDAVALAAATGLLTLAALPRPRRPWPAAVRRVELPALVLSRPFTLFMRRGAHRPAVADAFVDALRAVPIGTG